MKKIFMIFGLLVMCSTSHAEWQKDGCFSVSFDGQKIVHSVAYDFDWLNRPVEGYGPGIKNVIATNWLEDRIISTTFRQDILDVKTGSYQDGGPGAQHVRYTVMNAQGQNGVYDIEIKGQIYDVGGGVRVVSGSSAITINGHDYQYPVKITNYCPRIGDYDDLAQGEELMKSAKTTNY